MSEVPASRPRVPAPLPPRDRGWAAVGYVHSVSTDPDPHPDQLLRALSSLEGASAWLRHAEAELLTAARGAGLTWREIAGALDLGSPQAAAQRAGRRPW